MPIVAISRGSFTHGSQVAEKVAQKLRYECVARESLLAEASGEYDIPEVRLMRAVDGAPSLWQRLSSGKDRFVAYIEAAVLKHLRHDDVVYHGLFGHLFVATIPQILKVRVVAGVEDRASIVMLRDKVDRKEAIARVRQDDQERNAWSRHFYGVEVDDPTGYDLVLNAGQLSVDVAAEIVCRTVELPRYQIAPAARRQIDDLAIAAAVKAAIVDIKPAAVVQCAQGRVEIAITEKVLRADVVAERVRQRAVTIAGVEAVEVHSELSG